MINCIGIINSSGSSRVYGSLTKTRPQYMLPYAGRYRVVDFALSNIAEHGISKVMLYAGRNIRSTLDHIGNGKSWGLDKRVDGLMINPVSYTGIGTRATEIKTYFDSLPFYEDARQDNIYIANPMVISRIDITKAYDEFISNEYDVMLLYRKQKDETGEYLGAKKIFFDENGDVYNVGKNLGTEDCFNMYIENLFIKKDLFIKLVRNSVEKGDATTLIEAVMNMKGKIRIGTLELFRHVEFIRDVSSFYRSNLNLLNYGIYTDMLLQGQGVLTKSKDEPSTLYIKGNKVTNSIVANGCIIEGEVENSVIFRGAKIGKGAIVKNSIIFQKTVIEDNAIVVNSIVDKNCIIKEKVFVQGTTNNPYVVEKNKVIERG